MWDGSATANGIAFITETHSFVVAVEPSFPIVRFTGQMKGKPSSLSVYGTEASAVTDLDGIGNTAAWLSHSPEDEGDDAVAFGYCTSYVFPNGRRGYLGSAGELEILRQNLYSYWACYLLVVNHGNYDPLLVSSWSSTLSAVSGGAPHMWVFSSRLCGRRYDTKSSLIDYISDGTVVSVLPLTTLGAVKGVVGEFEAVVENLIDFRIVKRPTLLNRVVMARSSHPVARDVVVNIIVDSPIGEIDTTLTIPEGSSESSSSFMEFPDEEYSIVSIDPPLVDSKYYYCF